MTQKKKNTTTDVYELLLNEISKLSNIPLEELRNSETLDLDGIRRKNNAKAWEQIKAQEQKDKDQQLDKILTENNIDPHFCFEQIKIDTENQHCFDLAKGFSISTMLQPQGRTLLLLTGEHGSGKTVFCNCIANELLSHDESFSFALVKFNTLVKLSIFDKNEDYAQSQLRHEKLDHLFNCDLLILEDILIDHGFSGFEQQIFAQLLRDRYEKGLNMVITTICPMANLREAVGDNCYESIKQYSVLPGQLLGSSRRAPLVTATNQILP